MDQSIAIKHFDFIYSSYFCCFSFSLPSFSQKEPEVMLMTLIMSRFGSEHWAVIKITQSSFHQLYLLYLVDFTLSEISVPFCILCFQYLVLQHFWIFEAFLRKLAVQALFWFYHFVPFTPLWFDPNFTELFKFAKVSLPHTYNFQCLKFWLLQH